MNNLSSSKKICFRNGAFQGTKGFTLLEVVIGVTVLSVGLLAVGAMQINFIRSNSFSYEFTEATTLGVNILEILNNTPLNLIVPGIDLTPAEDPKKLEYTSTWRVAAVDKNNPPDGDDDWIITESETEWGELGESQHKVKLQTTTSRWD